MDEGGHGPGDYVRKVLDGGRRYTQELLDRNEELRGLIARMQVQEQHQAQQIETLRAASGQVTELKARLLAAEQESRALREELAEARAAVVHHVRDHERLSVLLKEVDGENRRYGDEFVQLQQQANNLANLYVAIHRLHGTLDRDALVDAILEILANLVGSEEAALFEVDRAGRRLVLFGSNGLDARLYRSLPLDGGLIGSAVSGGETLVVDGSQARAAGEERLSAVVPLRVVDEVVGAIALFRLLPQKPRIGELDLELFEVLASHAGMALYCADLHARSGAGR